jgi:hypothetical protein
LCKFNRKERKDASLYAKNAKVRGAPSAGKVAKRCLAAAAIVLLFLWCDTIVPYVILVDEDLCNLCLYVVKHARSCRTRHDLLPF